MISAVQIFLLTLVAAFTVVCGQNWWQTANQPVFVGAIAGVIMGDPVTGLFIGGSMQLTVLGIGTFGGSSHIDANTGSIIATAFSVAIGMDPSQALAAIAVPVAALLTMTDVLGRFCNTFFQHRIDAMIEREDYAGIQRNYLYGIIPWALSRALPCALALTFGQGLVQSLMDVLSGPLAWLGAGLGVAGAVLPAVGFAILLRYLPVKKKLALPGARLRGDRVVQLPVRQRQTDGQRCGKHGRRILGPVYRPANAGNRARWSVRCHESLHDHQLAGTSRRTSRWQ